MPYVTICKKCLIMLKHDVQSKFQNVFEARMQNKFLGFFCYDDRVMISPFCLSFSKSYTT